MPKAKTAEPAPAEPDLAPLEEAENELNEDDDLDDDDLDDELDEDEEEEDERTFKVEASAEGKASALRLVDLLLEKGGMALSTKNKKPGPKLIESIAKILEAPGSLSARASKLSETMVDSEDVDDLFVEDEVLAEILKRW